MITLENIEASLLLLDQQRKEILRAMQAAEQELLRMEGAREILEQQKKIIRDQEPEPKPE